MLQCGMSGKAPETPVVNTKTGVVYEKQLVEKYIAQHGADPITNVETDLADLVALKPQSTFVAPNAADVSSASIPGLVANMQKEWDALMLDQFETKKELHSTRQQLARALYENDAAFRVIARLVKERDQLKDVVDGMAQNGGATKKRKISNNNNNSSSTMDVDDDSSSGTDFVVEVARIKEIAINIAGQVKPTIKNLKDSVPAFAALKGEERKYHSSSSKKAGITSVDVSGDGQHIVTGGVDGSVIVSERASGTLVHTLKGHSGAIAGVAWSNSRNVVVSAAGSEVRFWSVSTGELRRANGVTEIAGKVASIAMHPSGDYVAVGTARNAFEVLSVVSGQVLASFQTAAAVQVVAWHPFGQLVGVALANNVVQVYDVASTEPAITLDTFTDDSKAGSGAHVSSLSFSNNGKWLAGVNNAGFVVVWVLKKQEIAASWLIDSDNDSASSRHSAQVAFDASCTYLFCARDKQLSVVRTKGWERASEASTTTDKNISAIAVSHDAQFVATSTLGRSLILHTEG